MKSSRNYDFAVVIGRFQPFHFGHLRLVKEALARADKVIVLVGSSEAARSTRNPFTYKERESMIRQACVTGEVLDRVIVHPLPDSSYNEQAWIETVQMLVAQHTGSLAKPRVVLVGNERDHTSYYLRLFPQWSYQGVPDDLVNATAVRRVFFTEDAATAFAKDGFLAKTLPSTTVEALRQFHDTPTFRTLVDEASFYDGYRKEWGQGPFVTVDSVVIQSGHVLMIQRGELPGKGQWALPGGFLNLTETLLDGAIRELGEETNLIGEAGVWRYQCGNVSTRELKGALKGQHTFDNPHRDVRGRVITTAFLFELPAGSLPTVKAADDAAHAEWRPLSEVRADECYGDHFHIIRHMLAKL